MRRRNDLNVRKPSISDKRYLHGMLYRPLDQRAPSDGGSNGVLRNGKRRIGDSYEMNDLPASDYERKYAT